MTKLPETLQHIYDPNCFPEIFFITEVPSEIIQKLKVDHNNTEIKNRITKNQQLLLQTFLYKYFYK